jgi:hypothetical protein
VSERLAHALDQGSVLTVATSFGAVMCMPSVGGGLYAALVWVAWACAGLCLLMRAALYLGTGRY